MNLPVIARKTEQGMPRYDESDVFILSGSEDLCPMLVEQGDRWVREQLPLRTVGGVEYRVQRYRPRVEGAFARIERWRNTADPAEVFWRSISRDNVTTWYGRTPESRVHDPADSTRVFQWLVCLRHDDKGNVVTYTYKGEDDEDVDIGRAFERGRERRAARYLKRVRYGGHEPYLPVLDPVAPWPEPPGDGRWHFELVFDYGEHDPAVPVPADGPGWIARPDAFSSYRAGFEVRTHRLCRRVLMFHHFPDDPEVGADCLVKSTDFAYTPAPYAKLTAVSQSGYQRRGAGYRVRSQPPVEFEYSEAVVRSDPHEPAGMENLPVGLDGAAYRWIDLDGDGVSGVLTEQAGAWLYKRNLGPLAGSAAFGVAEVIFPKPRAAHARLVDLDGDGRPDLVRFGGAGPGFHRRAPDGDWEPFTPFRSVPHLDWDDPDMRLVDLTGDGRADVLITERDALSWHPSLGVDGFGPRQRVPGGLGVVFDDGTQSVHLADMTGDGLVDLVRVRCAEVCYWPNLGHGRFGAKVTMEGPPLDRTDQFDPRRVLLADVDGSGTTDIIYLHPDGVRIIFNQSGNTWAPPVTLPLRPPADTVAVDLLGNGTACLVWSSPLPRDTGRPVRYVDLMGGQKPHLLVRTRNNLGMETDIEYAPSTAFAMNDAREGRPWATRLPFPVHVVQRVTVRDKWTGTSFTSTYSYHHGHFDGPEREFRGFGRVEQVDVEDYGSFAAANTTSLRTTSDERLYQPPVKTVTWYDLGVDHGARTLRNEYHQPVGSFQEHMIPGPDIDPRTPRGERHEARRACRGTPLRQEVYELDGDLNPVRLLSAVSHAHRVRMVQPRGPNPHAVYHVVETESITYHYEWELAAPEPDPRITHAINLDVDEYGNVRQAVTVGYGRVRAEPMDTAPTGTARLVAALQGETHIAYTETHHTDDVLAEPDHHRLRLPCEVRTCEITGVEPAGPRYFSPAEFRRLRLSERLQDTGTAVPEITYHELPHRRSPQQRTVEHVRSLYFDDQGENPLPFGRLSARALPFETYALALTLPLLRTVLGDKLTPDVMAALDTRTTSGYLSGPELIRRLGEDAAGQYWRCSGTAGYQRDPARRFLLPERYTDPFGTTTRLDYDAHHLFLRSSTDALGNRTEVEAFDYRVLAPRAVRDPNGTVSEARFDVLGRPTATAVRGDDGEGDRIEGVAEPDLTTLVGLFTDDYEPARAKALLGAASTRDLYYFGETISDGAVRWAQHPPCAAHVARESHDAGSPVQTGFEYSDGAGNTLVRKLQAEPAVPGGPVRWISSGKTVVNNKGKAVKRYEPYFSPPEVGHRFEETREAGVAPCFHYDALGRLVRTDSPDGSHSRVDITPWRVTTHDLNDTVLQPGNAWFTRMSTSAAPEEQRVARLAAAHADTPEVALLDGLGRTALLVAHNRTAGVDSRDVTFTKLDAEGNPLWVQDARGIRVVQHVTPPVPAVGGFDDDLNLVPTGFSPCYDITGRPLFQRGAESGDRWLLHDAAGKPMYTWTGRGFRTRVSHDALQRLVGVFVSGGDLVPVGSEVLVELHVHGEAHPDAGANLRGRTYQVYDGAGVATNLRYDFKGNLVASEQRYAGQYRSAPDWSALTGLTDLPAIAAAAEPLLEPGAPLTTAIDYDAMNRPVAMTQPDGSVCRTTFNEANLVETVSVLLPGAATATPFITGVEYNARGQRTRVDFGNSATTRYDYDPMTFRLTALRTTRPAGPDTTPLFTGPTVVQDVHYTYDPVGNIVRIADSALQSTVHAGTACEYVYDARYRLVAASGREHSGQTEPALDVDPRDLPFAGSRVHPNDLLGLRGYVEQYRYDQVGNILALTHRAGASIDRAGQLLWEQRYQYALDSNRLVATSLPGDPDDLPDYAAIGGYGARYQHDPQGGITAMPHLSVLTWDHRDQLATTSRQVVRSGTPETTYYVYDAAGERVRKVTETSTGARKSERRYLGGYEIYREYGGGGAVVLERRTLHVMDDKQRVAMVEHVAGSTGRAIRYQFGDHLGSARVELDEHGALVSFEDYHPYGTTAFSASARATEVRTKRYRHTGKERDDESGFTYHGARYYAPWLARWTSSDPVGIKDDPNVYAYVAGNPITFRDPTGTSLEQNVLNELKDTFKHKGILYAEEVRFYVLDASGSYKVNTLTGKPLEGRADLVWEDPTSGKIQFLEGKGTEMSSRTPNQREYIPEFERGGGWEIRGTKGGNLGLSEGVRGSAKNDGFRIVHSGNVKEFIGKNLARFSEGAGKMYRFVTVSAKGERSVKLFNSAEELSRFAATRGAPVAPVKVDVPAPAAPAEVPAVKPAPKPPAGAGGALPRLLKGLGGVFHVINIYGVYKEIEALSKGEDLTPKGYTDYGLGGRIITDFDKLPEGFSGHVISAPGHGSGHYEKRDGKVYKDGQRVFAGGA